MRRIAKGKVERPIACALPDQVLRQRISALQKLEYRCFASRRRFTFYCYLAAVYEFYAELRRMNATHHSTPRIAKLFNVGTRGEIHPIRLIIDASSQADHKTKSRWTRALRFAWRRRLHWSDLRTFLRCNGGPAGCASQFAALHPRPPRGYVRVGGEERVPKVPLFVSRISAVDWGASGDTSRDPSLNLQMLREIWRGRLAL